MPSTRDLSGLPDVDTLRRLLQSLAMLDAILSPDWQYRYFSFNSRWTLGEQMGSMRNGQADEFFSLFNSSGCFFKGFVHDSEMSPYSFDPPKVWAGVLDEVPEDFASCLEEPAFMIAHTTFCIWRRYCDITWQRGQIEFPDHRDPDGSEYLTKLLDGRPETYLDWASLHHSKPFLTLDMVRHIYEFRPLTNELIRAMTPDILLDPDPERPDDIYLDVFAFEDDAIEIGYPIDRNPKRDEEGKIIG